MTTAPFTPISHFLPNVMNFRKVQEADIWGNVWCGAPTAELLHLSTVALVINGTLWSEVILFQSLYGDERDKVILGQIFFLDFPSVIPAVRSLHDFEWLTKENNTLNGTAQQMQISTDLSHSACVWTGYGTGSLSKRTDTIIWDITYRLHVFLFWKYPMKAAFLYWHLTAYVSRGENIKQPTTSSVIRIHENTKSQAERLISEIRGRVPMDCFRRNRYIQITTCQNCATHTDYLI